MGVREGLVPTLVVHGIWDSAARIEPLRRGLAERGIAHVEALDLVPNTGSAEIPVLGAQVGEVVERLARASHDGRVDLVGFSMGALTSRWFVQRGGGRSCVRRFVSLSGPHNGTATAFGLPLAGARQMRIGSAFLADLNAEVDPWGPVEVHAAWTKFDLMILPPRSGRLRGVKSEREFSVPMHRFMMSDARVLDWVAGVLRAP